MSIEALLLRNAGWLSGAGPDADIVISTRVRLARNLQGEKYTLMSSPEERRRRIGKVRDAVPGCGGLRTALTVSLEEISENDRLFLVERRLISPELSPRSQGAVLIGERETVSLMVNEEDHLRIQVLLPGLALGECWRAADLVDNGLGAALEYEFDRQLGYLTACPSNVGTGLRASVMLHLPILGMSGAIEKIVRALGKLGMAVRGFYGEGSEIRGNLYQFSNQATLGCPEAEIVSDLERVVKKVIAYERQSRRQFLEKGRLQIEDRVFRDLGLLRGARLLTSAETVGGLSGLRIGIDLELLPASWREMINDLLIVTQPAHLQKLAGEELDPAARDRFRAELVRRRLEKAPERD